MKNFGSNRDEKIELVRVNRKDELPPESAVLKTMGKLAVPVILISIILTGYITVRRYTNFIPQYRAVQTILINRKGEVSSGKDEAKMLQDAVYSYADLSRTSMVLNKAKEKVNTDLDIQELKNAVDAVPKPLSQMVEIGVTTDSEKLSMDLSNAVVSSLKEVGLEIRGEDLVTVIDVAERATQTGSRINILDIIRNFIKYLAITITAALFFSVIREVVNRRVSLKKAGRK